MLKIRLTVTNQFLGEFEAGMKSREKFRDIRNSRLGPNAIKELHEILQQDTAADESTVVARMSEEAQREYETWEKEQSIVRSRLLETFHKFSDGSRFFTYPIQEDGSRKTIRLGASGSGGVRLLKNPRPFHAFFSSLKKGECAWTQPRRWTISGFAGNVTYFTQGIDGEGAEGTIKILQTSSAEGVFHSVIESSSEAVSGKILILDSENRSFEIPILWEVAKTLSLDFPGLSASNGWNIEEHTRSKTRALYETPAYIYGKKIPLAHRLVLTDPDAKIMSEYYQNDGHYAGPYLLFDGSFDGDTLTVLDFDARKPLTEIRSEILFNRLSNLHYDPEEGREKAVHYGYDPKEIEDVIHIFPGQDEATRTVLADLMNGSPATDQATAALTYYRVALETFPQDPNLLQTRLLEGIENNAIIKANRDHSSYHAALQALDAALRANAAEVSKYEIPHWQELIASRMQPVPLLQYDGVDCAQEVSEALRPQ